MRRPERRPGCGDGGQRGGRAEAGALAYHRTDVDLAELRATPPGGTVRLTAAASAGRRRAAVVTVADTGTGIAPDELPHIFDRFRRADSARGRATGGSGLGLAIARQIVTDHGGQIPATSHVGAGTVVTIRLPSTAGGVDD